MRSLALGLSTALSLPCLGQSPWSISVLRDQQQPQAIRLNYSSGSTPGGIQSGPESLHGLVLRVARDTETVGAVHGRWDVTYRTLSESEITPRAWGSMPPLPPLPYHERFALQYLATGFELVRPGALETGLGLEARMEGLRRTASGALTDPTDPSVTYPWRNEERTTSLRLWARAHVAHTFTRVAHQPFIRLEGAWALRQEHGDTYGTAIASYAPEAQAALGLGLHF